ncbi:MAG TPA: glutamate--tRNA ligase [Gemmatimonadaceae bacterium]|jgi:glutamyl-tRNA synthetase|nr:glutamate--tRNA ligase [Gemmatimonadaceae bacterium]
MTTPRLRFAPSPTGYLHVGGARTALFNWLYARKYGGQFLLRIEDTDRARSTDDSTRAIFDGLNWLGLGWDEEVVYQGANLARHQADAARLLDSGAAYRCFCTRDELDERRHDAETRGEPFKYDRRCDALPRAEVDRRVSAGTPFTVRFRVPDGTTTWDDLVHGTISFPNKDIEDFVILRSDGTPIYNLAVVSDDLAMRITVVMRGDDHISNTPKQIMLYHALGGQLPTFAHLPMIHGLDGKKLSKRHGATAVGDYQHMGILPQAMLNFLALLGWSPGHDIEVMTLPRMIELFATDGLLKKASVFDPAKLEWMNGQHLSLMSSAEVEPRVTPALVAAGLTTADALAARRDWYLTLLDQLKIRSRTIDDIVRQAAPFLRDTIDYAPDAVARQWKDRPATAELLRAERETLAALEAWEPSAMEAALRALADSRGLSGGKVFQPLRVALTGLSVSPGIFDVLVLVGRERSLARIDAAIEWLTAPANAGSADP